MDYDDLLNGLVSDLELDPDDLPDPPDLPAELVLVEDGEVNVEAAARLDYLRDYAVMVHGTAVLELVERDDEDEPENVVVRFLDPVDVTISVEENDLQVREGDREVPNALVDAHEGEQDHYGTTPVEAVEAEANVLRDLELESIALAEEGYENSSLGPVEEVDRGEH